MAAATLEDIAVVQLSMDDETIERSPGIKRSGYGMVICHRGQIMIEAAKSTISLEPEQAVLVDADAVTAVSFDNRSACWSFCLTKSAALKVRLAAGSDLAMMPIGGRYPRILTRLARAALVGVSADESSDRYFAGVLLSGATAAIRYQRTLSAKGERGTVDVLSEALRVIDSHASDPDFTIQQLAVALGIPMRQLQRAFVRHQEPPSQALKRRRLLHVGSALEENPTLELTDDLARATGFNSRRALMKALREHR